MQVSALIRIYALSLVGMTAPHFPRSRSVQISERMSGRKKSCWRGGRIFIFSNLFSFFFIFSKVYLRIVYVCIYGRGFVRACLARVVSCLATAEPYHSPLWKGSSRMTEPTPIHWRKTKKTTNRFSRTKNKYYPVFFFLFFCFFLLSVEFFLNLA